MDNDTATAAADITSRPFGVTSKGEQTTIWTVRSKSGLVMEFADYGARLVRAYAPDRHGNLADVALGWNTVGEYERYGFSMGTVIGRYGNRIADGRFTLDGVVYSLPVNENGNGRHCNLHGGPDGWDKKVWKARPFAEGDVKGIAFSYVSADGEMGFPGKVEATVTYRVTPDGVWRIDYEATTDKPTVLNPTNHSYWNLAGEASGDVLGQELQILADSYLKASPGLIPTEAAPVEGTGLDFREMRPIGEKAGLMEADASLAPTDHWYDHNYILRGEAGTLRKAAEMRDPVSGRRLEVWTTEPGMQVYGAQHMTEALPAKTAGRTLRKCAGIALETQHYPDSPNRPDFPSTVLRPGETFRSTTEFRFSAV